MAGSESAEKPMFSLRLLVDNKRTKVVLAEAGKEFVDVLFSFLKLPMGTIVRLLEKYQQNLNCQVATIGCFNNLYKSVSDLGTDHFLTEACKDMLLYPRSVNEKQIRRLKINIDDTEVLKYYRCSNLSCKIYSNFTSSICRCGELMRNEVTTNEGVGTDEIFFSNNSSFTITDKMEVGFTSMGLTLKILKELGYTDADQLEEMLVDVYHDKVLALLQCLFSSDTPLTDVFLMKWTSCVTTEPILTLQEGYLATAESSNVLSVTVFTRKMDKKVLHVESGKEFVDLLFTFLALPLESAWKMSGSNIVLGCIGNLCESLSSIEGINELTDKCRLPWYYSCQTPVLDVSYADRDIKKHMRISFELYYFYSMDPRGDNISTCGGGFVKRGKTFVISDDLIFTPMNLSSTICSLKILKTHLADMEEHVINISKSEAISLLRASLMTSTPLNTVLGSLLPKKPKEEKP